MTYLTNINTVSDIDKGIVVPDDHQVFVILMHDRSVMILNSDIDNNMKPHQYFQHVYKQAAITDIIEEEKQFVELGDIENVPTSIAILKVPTLQKKPFIAKHTKGINLTFTGEVNGQQFRSSVKVVNFMFVHYGIDEHLISRHGNDLIDVRYQVEDETGIRFWVREKDLS